MFRRLGRRFQPPALPPKLRRAHRLLADGDFENAMLAFHDLARKAEERSPERAPMLYIEAGRSAVLAGKTKKGVSHFRSGLTLLGTQHRFQRLQALGDRIVTELNERGLTVEADEIASVIKNNMPTNQISQPAAPMKHPVLPTHCPSCGAALHPHEVEWLDEVTAECDYCGSPVRSETE